MMIVVAGVFASCGDAPQGGSTVHSVMVTTPEAMEGTVVKNYSGIVREAHTINLGFKTPGQIERILVAEGDYVHKGQLLAELDDADYRLGVEALQIQYDQLKDEVGRTEQLYRQRAFRPTIMKRRQLDCGNWASSCRPTRINLIIRNCMHLRMGISRL